MDKPIIILGGGLWGGLLAYRLGQCHPDKTVLLYEKGETFGGNHTWSFHASDVPEKSLRWLTPFIGHSWESYRVEFPKFEKQLELPYHSILSSRFHEVLTRELKDRALRGSEIGSEDALLRAEFVIDARGPIAVGPSAYQKFLGLELDLEEDHTLTEPILMDARVPQLEGFRFMYVLPFSPRRILIEDTRYSTTADLDTTASAGAILSYAKGLKLKVSAVARREVGSLPIPLEQRNARPDHRVVSLRGIFHETTGYSLPDAVRIIDRLMDEPLKLESWKNCLDAYVRERKENRAFFLLLDRLMFKASSDEERYRVLEHFYTLPDSLIRKFYRGKLTKFDRMRFFFGQPPVPVMRALRVVLEKPQAKEEELQ